MFSAEHKSVAFVCLGCRVNRAEVDEFSTELLKLGFKVVDIREADFIIINTCTVTHVADKKTRQTVRKVCNKNSRKSAKIFVTGCAAAMTPDIYAQMDSRIRVIQKSKIIDEILNTSMQFCELTSENRGHLSTISSISTPCAENVESKDWDYPSKIKSMSSPCAENVESKDCDYLSTVSSPPSFYARSRANLKVQDGCDNSCTYCIVHKARGKAKSLSVNLVEKKFRGLLCAGHREIILSGVDLGAYNFAGYDLAKLCRKLLGVIDSEVCAGNIDLDSEELAARIRISSIEPQNVTDNLIELMQASDGAICRHLHLPLQSGSTKILEQMNRHYTAEEYLKIVEKLRSAMPQLSLSTDIIVGFPGETEEDFVSTLDVARRCGFMKIHVFPYSKREGTLAAKRQDQVPENVKSERAAVLRNLSDKLRQADLASRTGTTEYVLVETDKNARSESYHLIDFESKNKIGKLLSVQI